MIQLGVSFLCACLVLINTPGMMEGRPLSIAAGLMCAFSAGVNGAIALIELTK
jgi:hypothetical protein